MDGVSLAAAAVAPVSSRSITRAGALTFAALTFVLAGLASMGMPGFSGFPAELTILIGAWKTSPWWAVFAATGVLIAAAFCMFNRYVDGLAALTPTDPAAYEMMTQLILTKSFPAGIRRVREHR